MQSGQIRQVQNSWQIAAQLDPVIVGNLFYTRLFDLNPELRHLFKSPQPEQSRKLMGMLGYIVARLKTLDELTGDIQKLAQRHVHYGVKEKHYEQVGSALLWTLEQGLGELWNKELEEAWTACYVLLSSAMIDASQEAVLM